MIKSEWLKNIRSLSTRRRHASRKSVRPAAIERLESRTLLAAQAITGSPASQFISPGGAASIDVDYTTLDDQGAAADIGSTGIGLLLHFDSSKMTFSSLSNLYPTDYIADAVQPDTTDADSDPNTDMVLNVAWAKIAGGATWGQGVQPLRLYTANFTMDAGFTGSTTVNYSRTSTSSVLQEFRPNSPVINEFITPDVAISDAADVTEGGNSVFNVTLSTNPSADVTVVYDTVDGSATVADSDYTQASSQSIIFTPGGSLTQQISIPTTADGTVESDEGFQVSLTSANNGNIVTATGSAVILNDDVPTVSVSNAGSVSEGGSAVFTVSLDQPPLAAVSVVVSTPADTATSGSDYTAVSQTLTFLPNGSLSQDVAVSVTDDAVAELDETFQLKLDSVSGGTIDAAAGAGTATIVANDAPVVSIVNIGSVQEGQASAFVVRLTNTPAAIVTVDYQTESGTAEAGNDFTATSSTVTFQPGGALTQAVNIATIDDALVEPDENFRVNLSNVAGGTLGASQSVGVIASDDVPAISITGGGTIAEGQNAAFVIAIDQNPVAPVTVVVSTSDGTATAATDFAAVTNQTLTFNPGESLSQTISVVITDDTLSEIDETFTLDITSFSGATAQTPSATATISVNDDPVISIADDVHSETEGTGGIVVSLDQTPARTLTVEYTTRDGSAEAGSDYTTTTGTLTFAAGSTTFQTISFPILQDTLVEANENLFIDLSSSVNGTISDGEGEITITSEDVPAVSVSTPATVAEGQDIVLEFVLDQAPVVGGFVAISTTDGSATSPNDYAGTSTPIQVFFNVGDSLTQQVTIATVDDAVLENDETFTVDLSTANFVTISGATSVTGTITSDDVPSVSISDVSSSEGGDIVISVAVSEAPLAGQDVTVDFATADATAVAGTDYTALAIQQLTFTSTGDLTQQVTVSVTDDAEVEGNETFTATLSNISGGTLTTSQATATIEDNDVPAVSIADASIVNEGDDVVFTVSLDQAPVSDVLVTVSTMDGTAVATADYVAATGQVLTFSPGQALSQTVTIATVDDTLSEIDETFGLTVSQISGGSVSDGQASATISGSDLPRISISDALNVDETGQAVFVVSLDQNPAKVLSIDYTSSNGTATAGDDYTAVSGTLTFNPGDPLTQEITVVLSDDTLVEATETFSIDLSNPVATVVSDSQAAGSISSTDLPTVSISGNLSSVAEGGNTVFTVTLDQAPLATVTFDVSTSDGSAIADTDYTAINQAVTFDPGDSLTQQISVSTIDDSLVEISKTFTIDISNAVGTNVGTSQATGTITSNDMPTISAIGTAADEGSAVVFTISIDQLPLAGADVTVDVQTSDNVALAGTDYTAQASQTLTFTSTDISLSQTVSVSTSDDRNVETDETFFLELSNAGNGTIATAQTAGTITNNDTAVPVTFSADILEGTETDGTVVTITATSETNVQAGESVDVVISGTGITATDAVLSQSVITIPAGSNSGSVTLTILNDTEFEGDETATIGFANATGNLQIGSETIDVVIRDNEAPALDSTPRFSTSLRPVLTWQEAPGAAAYEIYFGRLVPTEEQLFVDQSIVTSESFQPPTNLTAAVYRYWVRTVDANGVGGTWSASATFEIQPLLVNPLTPTFTARPVFEWFPIPHADSYQIFVRTTTGDIVVDNITDTRWTPTSDLAKGPVFWWVRASDRKGNLGWSRRGETGTQTTVTAPVESSTSSTPTIQWLEAQGASRYILHVERATTREVIVRENNLTTTSFTTEGLTAGDYRVWVKAIDASGAFSSGRWSRAFDFTVATADTSDATKDDAVLTKLSVLPTSVPELHHVEARQTQASVNQTNEWQTNEWQADLPQQKFVAQQTAAESEVQIAPESLDQIMSSPMTLARLFDYLSGV